MRRTALWGLEDQDWNPSCDRTRTRVCYDDETGDALGWDMGSSVEQEGGYVDGLPFGEMGYLNKAVANRIVYLEKLANPVKFTKMTPEQLGSHYVDKRMKVQSLVAMIYAKISEVENVEDRKRLFEACRDWLVNVAKTSSDPIGDVSKMLDKINKSGVFVIVGESRDKSQDEKFEMTGSSLLKTQRDYGFRDLEEEKKERLEKIAAIVERRLASESGVPGNEGGVLETIYRLIDDFGLSIEEIQDGVYRCSLDVSTMPKKNAISRMKMLRKSLDEQEKYFNYLSNALSMTKTFVTCPRNKNLKALEFMLVFSPAIPRDSVTPESLNRVFSGIRRYLVKKNPKNF